MTMLVPKFHRRESPTQTKADALLQQQSQEVWGRPARGSGLPSVKAYRNQLPGSERGIQFTTAIAPERASSSPFEARWYYPFTAGFLRRQNPQGEDFAAIPASVINLQP